jgi:DNA polymerase III epsilon subunit family exonuclease
MENLRALCEASGADRFVVLDVETTGFGRTDQIVEVGMVTIAPDGRLTDRWESFIRPSVSMSPAASRVNSITGGMLRGAPTFGDVLPDVARRIDGACIVAHNASFDTRMLRQDFSRNGAELNPGSPIDTYAATRKKLEEALRQFGIRATGSHRAMADAAATAQLFLRIADQVRPGVRATTVLLTGPVGRPAPESTPRRRSAGERVTLSERRSVSRATRGGGASINRDDEALADFSDPVTVRVELVAGAHVVISTLTTNRKNHIEEHAKDVGLIIKPEITTTSVMLITDELASPSRRAMKARQRGVPFVLADEFLKARAGQTIKGVRERPNE